MLKHSENLPDPRKRHETWGEALFEKKNLRFSALIYEMLKNSENLPDPRKRHEDVISDMFPIRSRDKLRG